MKPALRMTALILGATFSLTGCATDPYHSWAINDYEAIANDQDVPVHTADAHTADAHPARVHTANTPEVTLREADDNFTPKYDVAGPWVTGEDPPNPSIATRQGRHVEWSYNTGGYKRVFEGEYVDGVTIKGIQTRWKRADHTMTRMAISMTFLSPDRILQNWVALDSHSDFVKGQTGSAIVYRQKPSSPSLNGVD
jgi:hypothetical protein